MPSTTANLDSARPANANHVGGVGVADPTHDQPGHDLTHLPPDAEAVKPISATSASDTHWFSYWSKIALE